MKKERPFREWVEGKLEGHEAMACFALAELFAKRDEIENQIAALDDLLGIVNPDEEQAKAAK